MRHQNTIAMIVMWLSISVVALLTQTGRNEVAPISLLNALMMGALLTLAAGLLAYLWSLISDLWSRIVRRSGRSPVEEVEELLAARSETAQAGRRRLLSRLEEVVPETADRVTLYRDPETGVYLVCMFVEPDGFLAGYVWRVVSGDLADRIVARACDGETARKAQRPRPHDDEPQPE